MGLKNAALLAIQILAVSDPELARQLDEAPCQRKSRRSGSRCGITGAVSTKNRKYLLN